MQDIEKVTLPSDASLRDAMRLLDQTSVQIVLVVDAHNKLAGTCTDGDIRRALLSDGSMDDPVSTAMNRSPLVAQAGEPASNILARMRLNRIRQMPVVDDNRQIVDLMMLADPRKNPDTDVPVVLIVGGLGKRLRPLTENCPKPMLKLGDRPILERTIERFHEQGFRNFFLSVNYLGHLIEDYFGTGEAFDVNIGYLREKKRLGTGGALSLIPEDVSGPIIVMNGDLITEVDFRFLLERHQETKSVATMCTREHRTTIPFGVVRSEDGRYLSTDEKPTLNHDINAGIYCLSEEAYRSTPKDEFYDMPTLFTDLVKAGHHCSVHRIDGLWLDIGTRTEFERAKRVFGEQ
ncbi:nucleotidyltransferase family protein [Glycocaulis abyssi]|uniref:Nucleotidyltransferase family protein n=1 Tax=Glycocaulis abyssi TaxID=1433403 RepID=A0ABV9N9C9_9PROT